MTTILGANYVDFSLGRLHILPTLLHSYSYVYCIAQNSGGKNFGESILDVKTSANLSSNHYS